MIKKGQLAWEYLENYRRQALPLLDELFHTQKEEAKKVGKLPVESLNYFHDLCRRGKFIRGTFITLGYRLGGGTEKKKILLPSLAIELFHTAILIHDDIMDEDNLRRGIKTAHTYFADYARKTKIPRPEHFGLSQAITLADTGFYLSWQLLLESLFPPYLKLKAGQELAKYISRLTYGQMLDITNETSLTTNLPEPAAAGEILKKILKIFRYKTAEYTGSLPLILGYILAGGEEKIEALYNYGLAFGWIFQIVDDLLGIFGQQEKLGKPLGSDLVQAKKTILVYYLLESGRQDLLDQLRELLGKETITPVDLEKAKQLFQDSAAYAKAQQLSQTYLQKGLEIIPQLSSHPTDQDLLKSFLYLVLEREK